MATAEEVADMALDAEDLNKTDEGIFEMLREGRCTPRYIAGELNLQQPYVNQRLKRLVEHGHVERIDRGLYELVDDPRDETENARTRAAHTETSEEQVEEPEPRQREDPTPETSADVSDDVVAAVEAVARSWNDAPHRLETRKNAAAVVLQHAVDTGEAVGKSSDVVEQVQATEPVEGQNAETYWRKNIRPVLKEYGQYNQGRHGYIVENLDE